MAATRRPPQIARGARTTGARMAGAPNWPGAYRFVAPAEVSGAISRGFPPAGRLALPGVTVWHRRPVRDAVLRSRRLVGRLPAGS